MQSPVLSNPSLTIIVPVYNESAALIEFLPKLMEVCQANSWETVMVDDGSTDGSIEQLCRYADYPGVTIIRHKLNRGYGGALKSGIRQAKTSHVVTLDGDGQHDAADIEPLFLFACEKDADMVVGKRGNIPHHDPGRKLGKRLIRLFTRMLMPLPVTDLNSGFKLYRRDLALRYLPLCPNSMAFSDLITLAFINQRNLVVEHPISIHERKAGTSTISIGTAFETVLEITNLVLLFNPLRFFLPLSAICILIGLIWGAHIVLAGRGVSVGAMLAIVTGILFAILGLIASQVSSLRLSLLEDHTRSERLDE